VTVLKSKKIIFGKEKKILLVFNKTTKLSEKHPRLKSFKNPSELLKAENKYLKS
jgi:hypothetical protein